MWVLFGIPSHNHEFMITYDSGANRGTEEIFHEISDIEATRVQGELRWGGCRHPRDVRSFLSPSTSGDTSRHHRVHRVRYLDDVCVA